MGTDERRVLGSHPGPIAGVAYGADGQLVASAGRDGTVNVWEPATGKLVRAFPQLPSPLEAITFSPKGRQLLVGDLAGKVHVLDIATGKVDGTLPHQAGEPIGSLSVAPESDYLAICGHKGGALWRLAFTGEAEPHIDIAKSTEQRFLPNCQGITIAPGGRCLAWTTAEGNVRLWDTTARKEVSFAALPQAGSPLGLGFSKDGQQIRLLTRGGRVEQWNISEQSKAGEFGRPADFSLDDPVSAWSPDGRAFACLSPLSEVSIWDAEQGKLLFPFPPEQDGVACLAWSPDRSTLVVGRVNGGVLLWHFPRIREQLAKLGL
jgi:WD40 repeat protein